MTLDAQDIIDEARRSAELDHFGGDDYREGLEQLTASLEAESDLNAAGQQAARSRLVGLLGNRLRIEHWIGQHPEVESESIVAPTFVLGLPRTGSTALAALLMQDPDSRCLRTWESAIPIPPPEAATQHDDPRIAMVQAGIDAMNDANPEWRTMYDASATASTESQDLIGMACRAWQFGGDFYIPSYEAWLAKCDMAPAYRWHERVLKLLQSRCPPRRWMLHSPIHALALDGLERVHPDARFIMTHRDPAMVLASVCSIISFRRALGSDCNDPIRLGRQQLDMWRLATQRVIEFRDRAGDDRFADLAFADLNADPVSAIERCYTRLGIDFSERARAAIDAWSKAHPRGRHGKHRYRLADFGLDADEVHERFAFYFDRFDIEREREPEAQPGKETNP